MSTRRAMSWSHGPLMRYKDAILGIAPVTVVGRPARTRALDTDMVTFEMDEGKEDGGMEGWKECE